MVIGVDLRVGIIKTPSHFTCFGNGSPDINKTNESYPSLRDFTTSLLRLLNMINDEKKSIILFNINYKINYAISNRLEVSVDLYYILLKRQFEKQMDSIEYS